MNKTFSGLLGGSPRVKVLEFLLLSRGNFEYHIKDIAEGSGISRPSCYKEIEGLKKFGVIVRGGKYKGKQLYKLNKRSKIANLILKTLHSLIYN